MYQYFHRFQIGETCLHYVASLDKSKLTDQAEDRGLTKLLLDSGGSIMIENFDVSYPSNLS